MKTEHSVTTNEIRFICGGKYCRYRRRKKRDKQSEINQGMPSRQEPEPKTLFQILICRAE